MNDHPSGYAQFAFAHERFAAQDAERSRYLTARCNFSGDDEFDFPPPERPCACGCGRPVARKPATGGPDPKYASAKCRYRVRDQLRKEREA